MLNSTDNQSILQAILGVGAVSPPTTLNTGVLDNANQQQIGGQLPNMQGPLDQNPNYLNTIQGLFGQQQSPMMGSSRFPQSPMRHTAGRDSWSSGMGLDHNTILNNIGLRNQ